MNWTQSHVTLGLSQILTTVDIMGSVSNGGIYIKDCVDLHHNMGSVSNGGICQGLC